jgi:hypothetical protein
MNAIDFILLYYDKLQKRLVNIKKISALMSEIYKKYIRSFFFKVPNYSKL